jgi:hypothetical protein
MVKGKRKQRVRRRRGEIAAKMGKESEKVWDKKKK